MINITVCRKLEKTSEYCDMRKDRAMISKPYSKVSQDLEEKMFYVQICADNAEHYNILGEFDICKCLLELPQIHNLLIFVA